MVVGENHHLKGTPPYIARDRLTLLVNLDISAKAKKNT